MTFTISANTGYSIATISVKRNDTGATVLVSGSGNTRTFIMPPASVTVSVTFSGSTVPSPITNLSATAGNGQATLSWTAPNNGGSAITRYEYRQRTGTTGTWGSWTSTGSASTGYTRTGLANGTTYNFQVRAVNAIGNAPDSNTAAATPVDTNRVSIIKNIEFFRESNVGAHYYAFSGYSNTYSEAYANIKLPTSFNNAGNYRNGFVALGIYGSQFGIDLGLKNEGTGWYPFSYDVKAKKFEDYRAYKALSTATNAIIVVKPIDTTTVSMYVQFTNANGINIGTPFSQNITVASGNLVSSGGYIMCRYYRFSSLVQMPTYYDNQMDGSYMLGGQFIACQLFNRSKNSYDGWGIGTAQIEHAWKVSPERITVTYSGNNDTFDINHFR